MSRVLVMLVSLGVLVAPSRTLAWEPHPQADRPAAQAGSGQPATANPWADPALAEGMVKLYLDRMKLAYTTTSNENYPVLDVTLRMTNATHHLRIVVDTGRQMLYVFLNRYLVIKADDPQLAPVLERLMSENWNLNLGKFEWDKSDGEVRLSFLVTTENGVGYEAFQAIVDNLAKTGDKLWPELDKLTKR